MSWPSLVVYRDGTNGEVYDRDEGVGAGGRKKQADSVSCGFAFISELHQLAVCTCVVC